MAQIDANSTGPTMDAPIVVDPYQKYIPAMVFGVLFAATFTAMVVKFIMVLCRGNPPIDEEKLELEEQYNSAEMGENHGSHGNNVLQGHKMDNLREDGGSNFDTITAQGDHSFTN